MDIYSSQNPKNYTHQLQQRDANRILANKLVNVRPVVDTKIPTSYKTQKAKDSALRMRRSSQMGSTSQSVHQQNRSIEFSQSLFQATPGPGMGELDSSFNNANVEDPLYHVSTNRESGASPMPQQNDMSFFEPYVERSTIQRGRGPVDSLMSNMNRQQQSLQTSQHQGGSLPSQQSMGAYRHSTSRVDKQRQRQIENDNQVLLKKMLSIMNRKQNLQHGVPRVSKITTHNSLNIDQKNRGCSSDAMYAIGPGLNVEMHSVRTQDQGTAKGFNTTVN